MQSEKRRGTRITLLGSSIFKRRVGVDEMKRILGRYNYRDRGGRTRAFHAMREKCFEEELVKRNDYALERSNKTKPKNYQLDLIKGSLMVMVEEVPLFPCRNWSCATKE